MIFKKQKPKINFGLFQFTIMNKIILFLKDKSLLINSICIAIWVFVLYENFETARIHNSFGEKKILFVIPIFFILLSSFNIYRGQKRKNSQN